MESSRHKGASFYSGDLVLRLLAAGRDLTVRRLVVVALVVYTVIPYGLNLAQGTLYSAPPAISLISLDWIHHWTVIPILVPLFFTFVLLAYRQLTTTISDLFDDDILVGSRVRFYEDLRRSIDSRYANPILVFGCSIVFVIWLAVAMKQDFANWTHPQPGRLTVAGVYWYFVNCGAIYVGARFALVAGVFIVQIRRVFGGESAISVGMRHLHPDRCGGLRPISVFVFSISRLIFVLGLLLATFVSVYFYREGDVKVVAEQIGPVAALAAYLVLAPAFFFLPLHAAHATMAREKRAILLKISRAFHARFSDLFQRVAEDTDVIAECKALEAYEQLYHQARTMPVWPFDTGILAKFGASVVIPVLLPILVHVILKLV